MKHKTKEFHALPAAHPATLNPPKRKHFNLNTMSDPSVVEIIQAMLAPGIMISACGLLLLGMNNKYSLVVNRIRLLDDEQRKLVVRKMETGLKEFELARLENIGLQIIKLAYRIKLVRNAVIAYSVAVGMFILTCLAIGFRILLTENLFSSVALVLFLLGMIFVLVGIVYAALETRKGFEIVQIEIHQNLL